MNCFTLLFEKEMNCEQQTRNKNEFDRQRKFMNQEEFDTAFGYKMDVESQFSRQARKAGKKCTEPCANCSNLWRTVVGFVPIIGWLPDYNFKQYVVWDIIGGLTTGIMHVPQGIAYAVLSGVDPVYGLYSSFFPALFYMFFGTSRHCSIGSFAVVALMSGIANDKIMSRYSNPDVLKNGTDMLLSDKGMTPIKVATTLAFSLGIIQFATGLLRLQFLTAYFSDELVAGFTTGSAVHVFIAQIDDIFGIKVPKVGGPAYIFRRAYDIILRIPKSNPCTVIISIIAILFLYVGKDFISPFVNKRTKKKIPIPYELILVVISSFVSYLLNVNENYGTFIVGNIPAGLPKPEIPKFEAVPDCFVDALGIAAVTVAVHISMAMMLAKKMKYTIDPGQELYALGLSSMLGSLFPIYPTSTALGRTMVNVESGSKTQLSTLFSSLFLLTIILWIGPLLETLPMCTLAVIIIMALRPMFLKLKELPKLWPSSKIDFCIWLVALTSTVVIDVMEGLAISIIFALFTVIFRSQWPNVEELVTVSNDQDFIDVQRYNRGVSHPNIYILRFDSPLIFPNIERFKKRTYGALSQLTSSTSTESKKRDQKDIHQQRYLIIDCSCIACIDSMGTTTFKEIILDAKSREVSVLFASVNNNVRDSLEASKFFESVSRKCFFPTLCDAMSVACPKRHSITTMDVRRAPKSVTGELIEILIDSHEQSPPSSPVHRTSSETKLTSL